MAQMPDPDPAPLEVHLEVPRWRAGFCPTSTFQRHWRPSSKPCTARLKIDRHRERFAREVHGKPGRIAALCLSGGGIRSASFALGVLQSLAHTGC